MGIISGLNRSSLSTLSSFPLDHSDPHLLGKRFVFHRVEPGILIPALFTQPILPAELHVTRRAHLCTPSLAEERCRALGMWGPRFSGALLRSARPGTAGSGRGKRMRAGCALALSPCTDPAGLTAPRRRSRKCFSCRRYEVKRLETFAE